MSNGARETFCIGLPAETLRANWVGGGERKWRQGQLKAPSMKYISNYFSTSPHFIQAQSLKVLSPNTWTSISDFDSQGDRGYTRARPGTLRGRTVRRT